MNNSNEKKARRIATLLAGYVRDTLTPSEHDELDEWIGASDKNMRLFEELTDEKKIKLALELLNDNNQSGLVKKLKDDPEYSYVRRPLYRRFGRIAVAASLVLIAGTAAFFVIKNNSGKSTYEKITDVSPAPRPIVPVSNKAILILQDGSVINLETVKDGVIAFQGGSRIIKKNGQLKYENKNDGRQITPLQNTLSAPLGGNYPVTLADGTKAWLNAGSTITFPADFVGNDRRVSITGEVYFEVAPAKEPGPNHNKRFIVDVPEKNMSVEVLGTHFNINAYRNEAVIKTTLAEGSVKIYSGTGVEILKPNQQAQVTATGEIKLENVDADRIIGWKDHVIKYDAGNLRPVLRQICRSYDIELSESDANNIPTSSSAGTINLTNELQEILNGIEGKAPTTKLRTEGRKLIVTVTPS